MLNFLQKWVELEVTNDQERFFKSIAALEEAHIPYRQKGQHMNHGTRRAGRVGTLGEKQRFVPDFCKKRRSGQSPLCHS